MAVIKIQNDKQSKADAEQEQRKRKRLDELKLKDKLNNFDITLRNMKDRIDHLEKNNVELQNEINEQEQKIENYINNIIKAKIASECVVKEGDDHKTRLQKAKKKIALRSYYGMCAQISGADALVKQFKKEHNLDFNDPSQFTHIKTEEPVVDDERYTFDRPNSHVDQLVVNETLLGKRDSYNPYKHFLVNSPDREICFPLYKDKIYQEYFVVKFGSIKEMYRINCGLEEESTTIINPYKDTYPFDFFPTKNGNFIAKSKKFLGANFCLYIDFDKWRVSMYRFDAPGNSWVIHDFAEVIKYEKNPSKGINV